MPHTISFPFQYLNIFVALLWILEEYSNLLQSMGIWTNQLLWSMSHLCTEAVLHLCFYFIDILQSSELFFGHSISEVCVFVSVRCLLNPYCFLSQSPIFLTKPTRYVSIRIKMAKWSIHDNTVFLSIHYRQRFESKICHTLMITE